MSAFICHFQRMLGNVLILLLASFSLVYAGLCLYAYLVSDSMIFPKLGAASYRDGPNILKLETSGGDTISAYFLEAAESDRVLLYSHGNAEDLGHIRPLLSQFQQRGVSVFAYDYPGYGTSTGRPSEYGLYAAAEAAFKHLTEKKGYAPESVTLYGRSLGSGPASWLAARYTVAGLILDGAFSSTFRVMTKVKLLPFDKFDNLALLPKLDCPVLLIHGKQDAVIPFDHALKNKQALPFPPETLWVERASHNNLIETAGDSYWNAVLKFIHPADHPQ